LSVASNNEVVVKVPETSIPKIKVGLPVTIEADAYSGKFFKGVVTQVATQSTVDQNVTNFQVQTSVIDPQNLLRSGMNVNTKFKVGTLKNALVVPTVAIVRQTEGTGVYLAGGGSRRRRNTEGNGSGNRRQSRFTPIVTGVSVEDKTVVTSGLSAGDRVLLSFPQGERPASRTPSVFPGLGGSGGGGGGSRRGGGF
jgi:HlyD family secretion protein